MRDDLGAAFNPYAVLVRAEGGPDFRGDDGVDDSTKSAEPDITNCKRTDTTIRFWDKA